MQKFMVFLVMGLSLAGCDRSRPTYEVRSLEPVARQQVYSHDEYEMEGITAACGVNFSGVPGQQYPGLDEPTSAVIGYKSMGLPEDRRPRCQVRVNIEHHVWLEFDLSEITRDGQSRRLYQGTLSGEAHPGAANDNCPADETFMAQVNFVRPTVQAMNDAIPHVGLGAPSTTVDGTELSFRERQDQLSAAGQYTDARHGSAPNFVYDLSDQEIARLAEVFARETWSAPHPYHATLLAAENARPKRTTHCLASLKNLKLTLVFR